MSDKDLVDDAALDRWMDNHPANPANLPDPTNKEQEQHEDAFSFEQFRDAQDRTT